MSEKKYLTAPLSMETMPPGVPYIIGNEAAERFCYYGMRTVLIVFMTKYLLDSQGCLDVLGEDKAKEYFHNFIAGVYFFPILGALLADVLWGKYNTILWLSMVYGVGNFVLAAMPTRMGLLLGLFLITLGAGGIKSCVSAHVGDQFGHKNQHLLEKVFSWFYFAINFGSFFSTLLTPYLLGHFSRPDLYGEKAKYLGPGLAFGVPGVLMVLAIFVFWMGRNKFAHIPPRGTSALKEMFSVEGAKVVAKLGFLFLFVAIFWSLYDQNSSAWVLQADKMDRCLFTGLEPVERWLLQTGVPGIQCIRGFSRWEIDSAQIQAINPLLILVMIPLFTYVLYPGVNKIVRFTPLRKIGVGMFLTAFSFVIAGYAEKLIDQGQTPTAWWQMLAFVVMTAAEMMVSITCLEFSYTQAPKKMKSLIMGVYLLSNSLGNLLTSLVNHFIQNKDGSSKLPGASYYWFFTGLMFATSLLFCVYAFFYREKTYIQDGRNE